MALLNQPQQRFAVLPEVLEQPTDLLERMLTVSRGLGSDDPIPSLLPSGHGTYREGDALQIGIAGVAAALRTLGI